MEQVKAKAVKVAQDALNLSDFQLKGALASAYPKYKARFIAEIVPSAAKRKYKKNRAPRGSAHDKARPMFDRRSAGSYGREVRTANEHARTAAAANGTRTITDLFPRVASSTCEPPLVVISSDDGVGPHSNEETLTVEISTDEEVDLSSRSLPPLSLTPSTKSKHSELTHLVAQLEMRGWSLLYKCIVCNCSKLARDSLRLHVKNKCCKLEPQAVGTALTYKKAKSGTTLDDLVFGQYLERLHALTVHAALYDVSTCGSCGFVLSAQLHTHASSIVATVLNVCSCCFAEAFAQDNTADVLKFVGQAYVKHHKYKQ